MPREDAVRADVINRVVDVDDPAAVAMVAAVVREWEPRLEFYRPPADALLYEPDGTLYAVCLADTLTVQTGNRVRAVRKGDALVIPQAYAVDVEPAVDLIAFRHDGPPPDHFRERFIQVWGLDHLAAPPHDPARPGVAEVIPAADVRFRIPYAVIDVDSTETTEVPPSDDPRILLGLGGEPVVLLTEGSRPREIQLPPRGLTVLAPGANEYRLSGRGRAGLLVALSEVAHLGRRRGPGERPSPSPSPEYPPTAPTD